MSWLACNSGDRGRSVPRGKAQILRWALVAAAYAACSSSGGGSIPNPLIRVDFSDKIPKRLRARAHGGIPLACTKQVTLEASGADQRFVASWRALDIDGVRYVTAVEVVPEGKTRGASSPTATAAVGGLERKGPGDKTHDQVHVTISWRAHKGCGQVEQTRRITLAADDPSCKSTQPKNLLHPVKDE